MLSNSLEYEIGSSMKLKNEAIRALLFKSEYFNCVKTFLSIPPITILLSLWYLSNTNFPSAIGIIYSVLVGLYFKSSNLTVVLSFSNSLSSPR